MSAEDAAPSSGRLLAVFTGEVRAEPLRDARELRLSGKIDMGSASGAAQLRLQAVPAADAERLPQVLHGLSVRLLEENVARDIGVTLSLRSREGALVIRARSVQLHRDASLPFCHAVPAARVSWLARVGWSLLLTLLRRPSIHKRLTRSAG